MLPIDKPISAGRWVWFTLILVVSIWIVAGNRKSVTPSYHFASQAWLEGRNLYGDTGDGFLYLPAAALVFMPFHCLPGVPGELLWRMLTIGCYGYGVYRLTQTAAEDKRNTLFFATSMMALPLAWSSARNGQSTLLMAGLMMLAAADVARQRWWMTTLWLSLGLAAKPLIIVMSLLVAALHRPLRWRLALGTLLVLAIPLAAQEFNYAWEQTFAVVASFKVSVARGAESYWAQLFGMLKVAGLQVDPTIQTLVRVLAALATLSLCSYLKPRYNSHRGAIHVFALSAIYLMLFNPRTENNTYSLLVPALALFAAEAWQAGRRGQLAFLVACLVGTLGSFELGRLITPRGQSVWLAPLMACCFAVYFVRSTVSNARRRPADMAGQDSLPSSQRRAA